MALTIDWAGLVIESTSSIDDLPAFHAWLRGSEASATGALYPAAHTWKALALGGGGYFYQLDLVNGWRLKFPTPGNYTITGNLKGLIIPVAGAYVERETSAAYITTTAGATALSPADIAAVSAQAATAVWAELVEAGFSAAALLRLIAAQAAGDATGLDGASTTFKSLDGTLDRITGQVAGGSRTITHRDGG